MVEIRTFFKKNIILYILLSHKMYPWVEPLKTNQVGVGDVIISQAYFLFSPSTLYIDLNLFVGIFTKIMVSLLIPHYHSPIYLFIY